MHGSMRRGLETEHPVMVTAVKRPAGETRGKVAAGPNTGQRHRASPRPYNLILGEPGIGAGWGGVAASGSAEPLVDEAITTTLRLPRGSDAFYRAALPLSRSTLAYPGRCGPPVPQEDRLVLEQAEPRPEGAAGPGAPAQRRHLRWAG